MSASNTNIQTQKRRHRPALIAIGAAVLAVGIAIAALVIWGGVDREDQAAPASVAAPE